MSNKERLNLLTDAEVSDLYSIPIFSDDNERDHFFTLSDAEHKLLEKHTSIKSKVYLIIQIGYFKAIQQFYKFSLDDVKDDVNFIIKKHYSSEEINYKELTGTLWKDYYREQKADILKLYGYRKWSNALKKSPSINLKN